MVAGVEESDSESEMGNDKIPAFRLKGVVGFYDSDEEESANRKKPKKLSLTKKSGGFQSFGLSFPLLKAIQKRGYKVPTPIQRKSIPCILEGRDVVAMARTGSGKTACFLLPILEKLIKNKTTQSAIKVLILCPTRELALQTMRFVRDLAKFANGIKYTAIVGGDSMDSQFSQVHSNPDIVVATPGRLLHIAVEMNLTLSSVHTLVLDEADRLFEMGLSEQLNEIIARLPESRQTLLFSATLPKLLVQFARAGLSEPLLIRLDVESKLPDTLEISFILTRSEEKAAALLVLLQTIIPKYRKTIIFAATRHHVDYLYHLVSEAGLKCSYIYSDLDASARKINTAKFDMGECNILIVTDLAARGIDIPTLDYVVNYNFPAKPKLFVHRVGRCARAGRSGHAISLVCKDECCYMLDIHLFLNRPFTLVKCGEIGSDFKQVGIVPRHLIDDQSYAITRFHNSSSQLESYEKTSVNAYKHYLRCRAGASRESVRRSKLIQLSSVGSHSLFSKHQPPNDNNSQHSASTDAALIISSIQSYRPPATIFEMGESSKSHLYSVMKRKRKAHKDKIHKYKANIPLSDNKHTDHTTDTGSRLEDCSNGDIEDTFSKILGRKRQMRDATEQPNSADQENYIPYKPPDQITEQGLSVQSGERDSSALGLDLSADTESGLKSSLARKAWNSKKKKMVTIDNHRKGKIKSESGKWIDATYKSGRYQQWKEKNKLEQQMADNDDNDDHQLPGERGEPLIKSNVMKHNIKLKQKNKMNNVGLKTAQQIVTQRIEKEKRQRRNGPKQHKGKRPATRR